MQTYILFLTYSYLFPVLSNLHIPPMFMIKATVSRRIGSPQLPLLAADATRDDREQQEGVAYAQDYQGRGVDGVVRDGAGVRGRADYEGDMEMHDGDGLVTYWNSCLSDCGCG